MSYDIRLMDGDKPAKVDAHREGGTYALHGRAHAELNITYNYSYFFRHELDKENGIRWLYGKRAVETIPALERAVKTLGVHRHDDYWAPTPGNAGYALSILLAWAKKWPEAVWAGD